jgi:hypothetical protein
MNRPDDAVVGLVLGMCQATHNRFAPGGACGLPLRQDRVASRATPRTAVEWREEREGGVWLPLAPRRSAGLLQEHFWKLAGGRRCRWNSPSFQEAPEGGMAFRTLNMHFVNLRCVLKSTFCGQLPFSSFWACLGPRRACLPYWSLCGLRMAH